MLPQSATGQILPKCGYDAGILFPKMRVKCGLVRSIQNAAIWMLKCGFYAGMPNIPELNVIPIMPYFHSCKSWFVCHLELSIMLLKFLFKEN